VTTPFAGAYCGSKAALHAVTDALRMELAPFGIRVMSVQPGGIMSEFGNNSLRKTEQVLTTNSWYHSVAHSIKARARVSQAGAMPGELFAKRLVSLTERAIPPAIVRIGSKSFSLPFLKAVLPASLLDALLSKRFGLSDVVL
ncbi:MAG TPA: SDR family NAD(P)-dependent oxidoreductase, partial [Bacteroidota bacterium]|nr:SDR family NAD(P)-dependent oxidoreductase [Bacteroidota bacterium]